MHMYTSIELVSTPSLSSSPPPSPCLTGGLSHRGSAGQCEGEDSRRGPPTHDPLRLWQGRHQAVQDESGRVHSDGPAAGLLQGTGHARADTLTTHINVRTWYICVLGVSRAECNNGPTGTCTCRGWPVYTAHPQTECASRPHWLQPHV